MQSQVLVDQFLDASDEDKKKDPYMMIEDYEIDVIPLRHQPTIAAFRNGWETSVYGKGAVEVLKAKLDDFDTRA